MSKHPRLISVDRIARYQGMPENRRHAIMMGWVDPVTIPPIYAACNDFKLNHLLSKGGFGVGCWRQPELLGPLIAQCEDLELRRVLLAALLHANPGDHASHRLLDQLIAQCDLDIRRAEELERRYAKDPELRRADELERQRAGDVKLRNIFAKILLRRANAPKDGRPAHPVEDGRVD